MRSITKLSLVVAALVLTGTALQAQTNNASITATASVQTPINVVGAQQLSFGNVFPGVSKTVNATDLTNGGRFDVSGQASTPVTLSFTLPATFSPAAGATPTLSGTGAMFVWVGAQVQPATNQVAGVYTGSIVMTVVY